MSAPMEDKPQDAPQESPETRAPTPEAPGREEGARPPDRPEAEVPEAAAPGSGPAGEGVPAREAPEPAPPAAAEAPAATPSEPAVSTAGGEPEPEPQLEPEPEREPEAQKPARPELAWYAIRVQSNKEDSVRRSLEAKIKLRGLGRKITQVVVPTEKIAEIKNGRKRTRQVKTYPGYVLLEMIMDDETWSFVRETPGVGDFVGGGGTAHQKPFPLLPEEVRKIFGQDVPEEVVPKIKIDFGVGDKVRIREGPFENFDGVVEEINEQKGLVRVVVTIFGRSTPVELQYWQVETI